MTVILPLRGHLAMSGDIFWLSQNWGGKSIGNWWAEAKDVAKHPTLHRTASPTPTPTKNYPTQSAGEVEKL